jgi:polysaccharide pyruvyl transferase CsaB
MRSRARKKNFDVLLAGYFGFGNLGDELLAQSAADCLSRHGIKRERIAILSGNPDATRRTLGIEAFARGCFSASLARAISESRSLLLAGGGIFQDATSVRSCFYYWRIVRKAIAALCPVAAVGQSIGPLRRDLSKAMTRDALKRCRYLSVRDETSLEVSRELGLSTELTPDLVMGVPIPRLPRRENGTVLVNVRPIRGSTGSAGPILKAARACALEGMPLRGIAMAEEDRKELEKFVLSGGLPPCDVVLVKTLDDFIDASEDAFAAVGMRLHFGILSKLRGLALSMMPYDPKVRDFAKTWDAFLPALDGISKNSDVAKLLTNLWFEDKKMPDRDEVSRAIRGSLEDALKRILGDGKNGHCQEGRT